MKSFDEALAEINKIKNEEIRDRVLNVERFNFELALEEGEEYEFEIAVNTDNIVITVDKDKIAAIYSGGVQIPVFVTDRHIKEVYKVMNRGGI